MSVKRVIVIGTSSGGIEALTAIAAALPADFPAPLCVVMHTSPDSPGILDRILDRAGPLEGVTAVTGERLRPGRIFVAPPDHHLLIEPGLLRITKGPRENRFRPAIDPLFRSAAQVYGPAAIGVVLTGNLDDGTAGLWVLKQMGGVAVVQHPDDALFPSMPRSALRHVAVDYSVPLAEIAPLLIRLVGAPAEERAGTVPDDLEVEVKIATGQNAVEAGVEHIGEPSAFACPECHGVLLRLKGTHPMRLRCHTGHAYSEASLVAAMNEGIEDGLWVAVRALEEGALLMHHLSQHARDGSDAAGAEELAEQANVAHTQANEVRQVVCAREALRTARR